MKLYLLIHELDTDSAWGADVSVFTDQDLAKDMMRHEYDAAIKAWEFDEAIQTEEHECFCDGDKATLRDDCDVETWRIEEHEISVEIAVELEGGLVQAIYANASVSADVYDLDVSDFPDEGEQEEADRKAEELEALKRQSGWRAVW